MDKMNLSLFRLSFNAPLHISNEREDLATGEAFVHSDTLYAAVLFAMQKLGRKDWINDLTDHGPAVAFSSLFPYYGEQYFLPRPLYTPAMRYSPLEDTAVKKKIKKSAWVDSDIFCDLLSDREPAFHGERNFSGPFWSARNLPETGIIRSGVVPRVTVPRDSGEDTRIFYIQRHYFATDAGLYVLASFDNEETKRRVTAALRLLGDEGLGTDRNIGHGRFTLSEAQPFSLPLTPSHRMAVCLGLFCPENETQLNAMLQGQGLGYDLIRRGGWLSEPYLTWRKKTLYMFTAGSVFAAPDATGAFVAGKQEDLRPTSTPVPVSHPVWRSGRTIFIPF